MSRVLVSLFSFSDILRFHVVVREMPRESTFAHGIASLVLDTLYRRLLLGKRCFSFRAVVRAAERKCAVFLGA